MTRKNNGIYRVRLLIAACAITSMLGCDAPKQGQAPQLVKQAGASPQVTTSPPAEVATPERAAQLRVPIESAHDYVLAALDEEGRFAYLVDPDRKKQSKKYNVLRHGGTIYALGDHFQRHKDPRTREAIGRATRHLLTEYARAPEGKEDMLAVFSRPEEENLTTNKPEAKLGGAALALLALHAAKQADAGEVDVETMRKLGRFILFMQREDGSFNSKYSEEKGFLEFESLYYPGEAILSLVRLYEVDGDILWLDGAARGVAHLVRSRQGMKKIPNDHWLMLAIEPLLARYDELPTPPMERPMIQAHATRLGQTMMSDQVRAAKAGGTRGAFNADNSCTPAATRLEGLTAVWRSMETWGDPMERDQFRRSISDGIDFLLTCQVQEGPLEGGILRAQKRLPGKNPRFNERQNEIRIDYVQHALSAMNSATDVL